MSEGDHYPWRRAIRFTLVAFVVFSLLPMWPAWYFGSWEANAEPASFWTMLASVPRALKRWSASELVLDYYGPYLVLPAVLLGGSLLVGRCLAGWPFREPVAINSRAARLLALGLFLLTASLVAMLGR